jgi:hypothetical protein
LKSERERMDIIAAYNDLGSFRAAGAICGVDPKTVKAAVLARSAHRSIAGMFSLSPDVRAQASRSALDLPGLAPDVRARHLALLFHNLVTAGRVDEARSVMEEATTEVGPYDGVGGKFVLELAGSGLAYADGEFESLLTLLASLACTSSRLTSQR